MAKRPQGRTTARRLLQSVLASEWAIRPEWLEQFAGIAIRLEAEGPGQLSAAQIRGEIRRALAELGDGRDQVEGVAADYGTPLGEGLRATLRDGVAIIPVLGPLYHYASEFDDVCGCSSYEQITRDLAAVRAAREGGQVRAAVLEIDSPGGEVGGCAETAARIRELAGEMEVVSYISDLGCSAGYWLSAAATRVVISKTALVGSIGVVATYRARKGGSGTIEIVSSQSPRKRPDVETPEGRAQVQSTVDAIAEVFVAEMARYRGVSVDKVLAEFGQGDVFVGARAVEAGLADAVGSFDGVLAELAERVPASHRGTAAAAGEPDSPRSEERLMSKDPTAPPAADTKPAELTAEAVAKDHPQIAEAFRVEGATGERTRILGIEEFALEGFEEVITAAKQDPTCSPEMAAARVMKAQKAAEKPGAAAGRRHLAAIAGDEENLDKPAAGSEATPTTVEAQVASIVNAGKIPAPTK